jgi:hypothetical protein
VDERIAGQGITNDESINPPRHYLQFEEEGDTNCGSTMWTAKRDDVGEKRLGSPDNAIQR